MSSDTVLNRQVILVERPDGPIVDATFAIRDAPLPSLAEGEALGRLLGWVQAGEIVWHEQVAEGIATAPAALQGLFEGRNLGKQLVRVWNPDA